MTCSIFDPVYGYHFSGTGFRRRFLVGVSWALTRRHCTRAPHRCAECFDSKMHLSSVFQGFIQHFITGGGGVSKNQRDITHGYTRDLLTYLLHYLVECCCVYLVHPKFDVYILSNNSRQDSFLAVSVKWISVNVNMFAIHYLSQIRHSHWYCLLIHCSLLSIIGLIYIYCGLGLHLPPNNSPLLYTC